MTDKRLIKFLQLQDRPLASPTQLQNLQSWLEYYPNAIASSESEFLDKPADLIVPRIASRTHFGKWMQNLGLITLAALKGEKDQATSYYNWNMWKSIGGLWLLICTSGILLAPLWAMPFAPDTVSRLAIVTAATFSFSILAIIGTTLKPSQRSLLVAGYELPVIL